MGFEMGPEDRPFSERHLGLGRQLVPTAAGRRGCMLMLVAGFVVFVLGAVIALVSGDSDEAAPTTRLSAPDFVQFCDEHRPAEVADLPVAMGGSAATADFIAEQLRIAGLDPEPWSDLPAGQTIWQCDYGWLGGPPDIPQEEWATTTSICANGQVAVGYEEPDQWFVDADGHASRNLIPDGTPLPGGSGVDPVPPPEPLVCTGELPTFITG